jgi:uncharacterized membrane protein
MELALAAARIIHVVGGVIWVGSMFFVTIFLLPAMNEAGPDAGKVMAALTRRNFMIVIPIIALLTILAGVWLLYRVSMGFNEAYLSSGPGRTYSLGATFAIVAFLIGMTITRPTMGKIMALSQSAATASPEERQSIMAQVGALRAKATLWGKVVLFLLLGTATLMSLGRYM